MKLDNRLVLVAAVVLSLVLFPVVVFTSGFLRLALGFLFVLFFPGYALISALFPRRGDLSTIERVALSFGLSMATVCLLGFVLNYTPWGIRLIPAVTSIAIFIIIVSAAGWLRQQRLPPAERFAVDLAGPRLTWTAMNKVSKGLSLSLLVIAAAAACYAGYIATLPREGREATEFYLLNAEGEIGDYPKHVILGQPFSMVVGIDNREPQPTGYRVEVTINSVESSLLNVPALAPGQKFKGTVTLKPAAAGRDQEVAFYLYRDGEEKPYFETPLRLYIDVAPPEQASPVDEASAINAGACVVDRPDAPVVYGAVAGEPGHSVREDVADLRVVKP